MALILTPVSSSPFTDLIAAIKSKIESTDLSFVKYLNSQGTPLRNVFSQTGAGGKLNQWDPPGAKCPAVVLLASAFPPVEDMGVGDERWFFTVTIMFKMKLPNQDATVGFDACWELIRTIMAGWRQPQLDPIGSVTGVCDYEIDGNLTPHISDPESGKSYARMAFDLTVRYNKNILGNGV